MEIKTHVLTNEQHLDDTRKERARKNIEAIGSIKLNEHDVVKGDVADLSGVVVPTPSAEDHQKVLTAGNDGSFGWNALPEGIAPYDDNPAMDGAASAGSSELFARGDHVHPADTSKANKSEMTITAVDGDNSKKNIQLKNDLSQDVVVEHQDISGKAEKSEMSITDVSGDSSKKTIQLKDGLSQNVVVAHQDISGKANASEMAITEVSGDASKKNIQLKNDLSQDVVVAHQDISGKEDNSNKVAAWSETTTDEHYPSEKLVKSSLDQKEDKSNKVTAWASQPSDTSYPSEKLTKDSLDTKANKSEMSVATDGDQTTITLKEGTSATVINTHQNISGKAEKSEMAIEDVAGDNTKKKITLKTGLSQDVVVAHQDLSGKADKVNSATSGNFAGLDANGNLTDSGKKTADFATAAQGEKADSAVQSVKMGSSSGTELKDGTNVVIPEATQNAPGVMSTSDKTKLDGIETGANKYIHPSHTAYNSGMYKVTIDAQGHVSTVAAIEKSDITALGIPAQDTTYNFADGYDGTTNKGATETTVRNAVTSAINALTKTEYSTGSTNIEIQIVEKNGLIDKIKVVTDNTVTATDVNTAIETALANYGGFKVVQLTSDTPPVPDVQNPSEKYIYLTKDTQSSARDPYTEWIYIKGDASAEPPTESHWEVIGETSVDLSNYIQKVNGATENNFAAFTSDGAIKDSGKNANSFATAAQGTKADNSVQTVSINNGTPITPTNGNVDIPLASPSADAHDDIPAVAGNPGAMSAADKAKLDGINNYIESATVTGRTMTLTPKSGPVLTFNDTGDINVIEKISVNGTQQTVTNKEVDLTIPDAANNAKITLKVGGAAAGDTTPVAGDFTVDQSQDKDIVIPTAVSASGNDPAKPGVMSSADKAKLDGIANGAEVNSIESITIEGDQNPLPISSENVTIPKASYTTGGDPSYTTGAVTGQDKKKLDEIESGAQVNDIEHIRIEGESDDLTIDANKRIELPLAASATTSPVAPAKSGIMSATDKEKLDTLKSFSNVQVSDGATPTPSVVDVAADNVNQALTLVAGNNITLTPDTTNKKITIEAAAGSACTVSEGTGISVTPTTDPQTGITDYNVAVNADLGYIYGQSTVSNPAAGADLLTTNMTGLSTSGNDRFIIDEDATDHHVYLYALKSSAGLTPADDVHGVDLFTLNINARVYRNTMNGYYYLASMIVSGSGSQPATYAEACETWPSQIGEQTVNISVTIKNSTGTVTTIDGKEYYGYRLLWTGDVVSGVSPDIMGVVTYVSVLEETTGIVQSGSGSTYVAGDAIDLANNAISVKHGSGLGLNASNELEVKIGDGLKYDTTGGVTSIALDNVTEAVVQTVQKLSQDLDTKLTTNFDIPNVDNTYDFADSSKTGLSNGAVMLCQAFTVPINNNLRLETAGTNPQEPTLIGVYAKQNFASDRPVMFALYEYDFDTNRTDYVADTGPVTIVAGRNEFPILHKNPSINELKSSCIYYASLYLPSASNHGGLMLAGCSANGYQQNINAIPRFSIGVQNITYNGSEIQMDAANGRLNYKDSNDNYYIGPWTNSYNEVATAPRFFMQIRNAGSSEVISTEPFDDLTSSYTLTSSNSINDVFGSQPQPNGDDMAFQGVTPRHPVTIKSWTFYDKCANDTNGWGKRVYDSGFYMMVSTPSQITVSEGSVTGMTGVYYHTYTSQSGITLSANTKYQFPAGMAYDTSVHTDYLIQYATPSTVKKDLVLFDNGASVNQDALALRALDVAGGAFLQLVDSNDRTWII